MTWQQFEQLVNDLLNLYGYNAINPNNRITGRGTTHQIDAIGINNFVPTFSYPITIIAEAKYYGRRNSVGIGILRNFYGVLTDIKQNQPNNFIKPRLVANQYQNGVSNIIGLVISTSSFSSYAREFAYAHSIYFVTINFIKKNHSLLFGNLGGSPVIIQIPNNLNLNPTIEEQTRERRDIILTEILSENKTKKTLLMNLPIKGSVKKITELKYKNERYENDKDVPELVFSYKYEIHIPDFKSIFTTITQNKITERDILLTIELPNQKTFLSFEIENALQQ